MVKTMFPSNQLSGYATEMNRLFSRHPENEMSQMASIYQNTSMLSPFQIANRSSSSADSTSPESYPDMQYLTRQAYDPNLRQIFETPRPTNQYSPRRRPIVGRKILATNEVSGSPKEDFDFNTSLQSFSNDDSVLFPNTPPSAVKNIFVEQKNYTQNVFYELFPEKLQEITPQKATLSPIMSNYSPTSSNMSNFSPPSVIPRMSTPTFHRQPNYPHKFTPSYSSVAASGGQEFGQSKMCSFCRKNGETPIVYMTHCVKEKVGNKHIVTCPILRSHVCSTCGASGDNAHTITYCPVLRSSNNGAPLRSTTVTLKNTRLKSNGRRRY